MLIIKCEHYTMLLFAACVLCSKMLDLDDTSGKPVTLTDLSSILHVIFKQANVSPAQLCYRAQSHPDKQHIEISFGRCSLGKFFRLWHQLEKFMLSLSPSHAQPCQYCCLHDATVNWITETIQVKATSWMDFDAGKNVCLCSNCSPTSDLPGSSKGPE